MKIRLSTSLKEQNTFIHPRPLSHRGFKSDFNVVKRKVNILNLYIKTSRFLIKKSKYSFGQKLDLIHEK